MLAHEMSHIRNYDVRLMTWAAVLAGSIALLAQHLHCARCGSAAATATAAAARNPIVLIASCSSALILAPIAAVLIQVAISRRREYVADAVGRGADPLPAGPGLGAAHDLGRPEALADARATRRSPT